MENLTTNPIEGSISQGLGKARAQETELIDQTTHKYSSFLRLSRFLLAAGISLVGPLLATGCEKVRTESEQPKGKITLETKETRDQAFANLLNRIAPGLTETIPERGLVISINGNDYRLLDAESQAVLEAKARVIYGEEMILDPYFYKADLKMKDIEIKEIIMKIGVVVPVSELPPMLATIEKDRQQVQKMMENGTFLEDRPGGPSADVPKPETKINPDAKDFL